MSRSSIDRGSAAPCPTMRRRPRLASRARRSLRSSRFRRGPRLRRALLGYLRWREVGADLFYPVAAACWSSPTAGPGGAGDRRGRQAAHLQVVDQEAWKYVDLRVDEHSHPVSELRRIFEVAQRELFPFRKLYPSRYQRGSDWDLAEYEQLISAGKNE